jgi:hypothetical protein
MKMARRTPRYAPLVPHAEPVPLVRYIIIHLPAKDEFLRVQDKNIQDELEER